MAIKELTTSRYVLPGAYIGQIFTPKAIGPAELPRIPCFVGRGSKSMTLLDAGQTRARVENYHLTFTSSAPYQAVLPYVSDGNKENTRIVDQDGSPMDDRYWDFTTNISGEYAGIQISSTKYETGKLYYITYQSTSDQPYDKIPNNVTGSRNIVRVGDSPRKSDYLEGTDFELVTTIGTPDPASGNTGTGVVNLNSAAEYVGVTRLYTIVIEKVTSGVAYWFDPVANTSALAARVTGTVSGATFDTRVDKPAVLTGTLTGATFNITDANFGFDITDAAGAVQSVAAVLTTGATVAIKRVINDINTAAMAEDASLGESASLTGTVAGPTFNISDTSLTFDITDINGVVRTVVVTLTSGATVPIATVLTDINTAAGIADASLSTCATNDGSDHVLITSPYVGSYSEVTISHTDGNADIGFAIDVTDTGLGCADKDGSDHVVITSPYVGGTSNITVTDAQTEIGFALAAEADGHDSTNTLNFHITPVAGPPSSAVTVTFTDSATNPIATVVSSINSAAGFTCAYQDEDHLRVRLISPYSGSTSTISIDTPGGGNAGLGFAAGASDTGAASNLGTGTMTYHSTTGYSGLDVLRTYKIYIANKTGSGASTTLDLDWSYTEGSGDSGIVAVTQTSRLSLTLDSGIVLVLSNLDTFVNDDLYTIVVGIGNVVAITWFSDDPQGGSSTANIDETNRIGYELEQGLIVDFVNLSDFRAADEYNIQCTNTDTISWRLQRTETETISSGNVYFDAAGILTGVRRTYYIALTYTPKAVTSVTNASTGAAIPYTWVTDTPYIWFATNPGVNLQVVYTRTNAPAVGQVYYITLEYTRPDAYYEQVLKFPTLDAARNTVGWDSPDNHLAIMSTWSFVDVGSQYIAVVQVKDSDGDGIYTTADYRRAILATEEDSDITDIIVLGNLESLGTAITSIIKMNDPFERKERLLHVGYPANTPIGWEDDTGTIANYAMKVLQVYGDMPGHGCFTSYGNTYGKRTITQVDGSQVQLTLDGSFIAAVCAAYMDTFENPSDSLLRKIIPGFDDMQTYGESDMLRLGTYRNTYMQWEVVQARVIDVQTTDNTAPDYKELNAMTQKQFVTRYVRRNMDTSLIGLTPLSAEDGVLAIRSYLLGLLGTLVSRGIIAPYTQANGSVRAIDGRSDIDVYRDQQDPTLYHFKFWYNLRYTIKRLFGLYSVDSKAW